MKKNKFTIVIINPAIIIRKKMNLCVLTALNLISSDILIEKLRFVL